MRPPKTPCCKQAVPAGSGPRAVAARARGNAGVLLLVLVCALILAPLLHQMHRVAHAHVLAHTHTLAHWAEHARQQEHTHPETRHDEEHEHTGWLHTLFDGHGTADCQLLDYQHATGANAPAVLQAAAQPPQRARTPHAPLARSVPTACFFDARAPPRMAA